MTKPITARDVRRQLKADLIGKDSHRGITLTYAWMANQFGHFSLGFIPTFIAFRLLQKPMGDAAALWAAVGVSALWLLFELYNFLGPLLGQRNSRSRLLFVAGQKYRFSPAWANIAFDTATDLLFFWLGAFTASVLCQFSWVALGVVAALGLLLLYPVRYWFLTKMYLQVPQYPLQFRLSQWENHIDEAEVEAVRRFVANDETGLHLLLFGTRGCGKTSLAVAIATELSIRHRTCCYTTAMKLFCLFGEDVGEPETLWGWHDAAVLVIDDLNPGDPVKDDIVSPLRFVRYLDSQPANRERLRTKNVVWVLGNEHSDVEAAGTWAMMLEKLGVPAEKILSVNLQQNGNGLKG